MEGKVEDAGLVKFLEETNVFYPPLHPEFDNIVISTAGRDLLILQYQNVT
jgi:hypothetical protein